MLGSVSLFVENSSLSTSSRVLENILMRTQGYRVLCSSSFDFELKAENGCCLATREFLNLDRKASG